MTTFTVTTQNDEAFDGGSLAEEMADGGGLSLREAAALANARAGADTIIFASALQGPDVGVDLTSDESIEITDDLSIFGGVGTQTLIDAFDSSARIFTVVDGTLSLRNLSLEGGGDVEGGAIRVGADATLIANDVAFFGNDAFRTNDPTSGSGGAVYVEGAAFIQDSVFIRNDAENAGGALFGGDDSVVALQNVLFEDNDAAPFDAGVGGAIATFGRLDANFITVQGNSAGLFGGGVLAAGDVVLRNSRIADNDAEIAGGVANLQNSDDPSQRSRLVLDQVVIESNRATDFGSGGGGGVLAGSDADTFIIRSAILNNESNANGGGLFQDSFFGDFPRGFLSVTDSVIAGNDAAGFGGGAILLEDALFTNVTITGNQSNETAGGILSAGGDVEVRNGVVVENRSFFGVDDAEEIDNFEFDGELRLVSTRFGQRGSNVGTSGSGTAGDEIFEDTEFFSNSGVSGGALEASELRVGALGDQTVLPFAPLAQFGAGDGTGRPEFLNETFVGVDLNGDGDLGDDFAPQGALDLGASRAQASDVVDVFRFQNSVNEATFLTAFVEERDSVDANLPGYVLQDEPEFEAFDREAALADGEGGLVEVFRFFNLDTGGHFFTIDESERDQVIANLPLIRFEGVGFSAYENADDVDGLVPVFRIFNLTTGTHLFITSEDEREAALATGDFVDEGVAFYAFEDGGASNVVFNSDDDDAPTSLAVDPAGDLLI